MHLSFFQLIRKFLRGFITNTCLLLLLTLAAPLAACSTASTSTVPTLINTPSATNPTSPATATNSDAAGGDWTTYHRDNARSGYLPDMPDPQQLTAAWNTQIGRASCR